MDSPVTTEQLRAIITRSRKHDRRPPFLRGLIGAKRPVNKYYNAIYEIARTLKPERVLELGVFRGVSAAHWALGNPEGQVYGIDCNPQPLLNQVKRIDNFHFILNETVRAADSVARNGPWDVVFFDSVHVYDQITAEVEAYTPQMAEQGFQLFDDIAKREGMRRFWSELRGDKDTYPNLSPHGFGVRVSWPEQQERLPLDYAD
jgi:predicted O-methyltransferase YrrM